MAAINRNHANYERRLNFIRREIPFPTLFNIEVTINLPLLLQGLVHPTMPYVSCCETS